jgi:hypothetical protein
MAGQFGSNFERVSSTVMSSRHIVKSGSDAAE